MRQAFRVRNSQDCTISSRRAFRQCATIMLMISITKTTIPFVIFTAGTAAATAIVIATLMFLNPPECPPYTIPQGSNCVIGANIGLGLGLLLATGLWVVVNTVATLLAVRNILLAKDHTKRNRAIKSILLVLIASLATYAVVLLFIGHVSDFGHS